MSSWASAGLLVTCAVLGIYQKGANMRSIGYIEVHSGEGRHGGWPKPLHRKAGREALWRRPVCFCEETMSCSVAISWADRVRT
jgi:hypothetical protein